MLVLGIESSCDETAAAVVEDGRTIRSNIITSQVATHAPFGGVVPELASREHLDQIDQVVTAALRRAEVTLDQIDGIAVTRGPGLVGSLLVGVSYAKSLAMVMKKPIVGINHIEGHIYSVVFENPPIAYPALALVVSGGHTTLFFIPGEGKYAVLGRTRDDAAGEAYDKVAKLLGLGYPGGPVIDRLSESGNPGSAELVFTVPRMEPGNLDFSFSGLKTAVLRYVREKGIQPADRSDIIKQEIADLASSFQSRVISSLIFRLKESVRLHQPETIIVAGGVASNRGLRQAINHEDFGCSVFYPDQFLSTDNAAMIASAATPRLRKGENHGLSFTACSSLKLGNFNLPGYETPVRARYKT